ncbi:hypothetical protein B0J11DRAFT_579641 [Dendryphion nanum]|uniref:Rhodopsin domain-containing protein n=1 Tax=Dendryphion nanum TaxID=256645 RepID=A0A9P9ILW8_9PLEO|nr:hypothetical protein B0J11DRAFT_579641 [Dendryphion nanum]
MSGTHEDKSVIQVAVWLLVSLSCLVLVFRFLTRFFLANRRQGGGEDVLIVLSFAFSLGQSIPLLLSHAVVLGGEASVSPKHRAIDGLKLLYTSGLFFILSLVFAKLSVCVSILHLTPDEKHRRAIWVLATVSILWGITSFFGSAFRCCIDSVWLRDPATCIDETAFQRFIVLVNIVADLALVGLAIWLVFPLNMDLRKRLKVIGLFSSRALVVVASIFEFIYIPRSFADNVAPQARMYLIVRQCVQFASIASACIAYFHPFFQSLRSGLIFSHSAAFPTHLQLSQGSNSHRKSNSNNESTKSNDNSRVLASGSLNLSEPGITTNHV